MVNEKNRTGREEHALRELKSIGMLNGDPMNICMTDNILELLRVLAKQGHSGFSNGYLLDAFTKLAKLQTLSPLTGNDDEWVGVDQSESNGGVTLFQNKRDSRVFKDTDGAYFIDGKVFTEGDHSWTNRNSHVRINSFPYTPKTKFIKLGWWNRWMY